MKTAIVGAALLVPDIAAASPVQFACSGALVDRARKSHAVVNGRH